MFISVPNISGKPIFGKTVTGRLCKTKIYPLMKNKKERKTCDNDIMKRALFQIFRLFFSEEGLTVDYCS